MEMFTFLDFGSKNLFWAYLVQKFKFVCSGKSCYLDNLEYAELNGGVVCICLRLETPSLGEFGPKNLNCQFQLKFYT